jgi:hypothetical protein
MILDVYSGSRIPDSRSWDFFHPESRIPNPWSLILESGVKKHRIRIRIRNTARISNEFITYCEVHKYNILRCIFCPHVLHTLRACIWGSIKNPFQFKWISRSVAVRRGRWRVAAILDIGTWTLCTFMLPVENQNIWTFSQRRFNESLCDVETMRVPCG